MAPWWWATTVNTMITTARETVLRQVDDQQGCVASGRDGNASLRACSHTCGYHFFFLVHTLIVSNFQYEVRWDLWLAQLQIPPSFIVSMKQAKFYSYNYLVMLWSTTRRVSQFSLVFAHLISSLCATVVHPTRRFGDKCTIDHRVNTIYDQLENIHSDELLRKECEAQTLLLRLHFVLVIPST